MIYGDVDEGYGKIVDEFRRNFTDRDELGAAVAVVREGATVVDLWGGHRDKRRTQPWERDTLVTVFSTTKGMAATAMAVAHSRGLFALDASVASYWPDFGQAGKERVTVRQLPDINTRELLRVELPSVNGTGTARAIATVYGDLATGGRALGIGRYTLDEIERETPASFDQIFGLESAFSFGFMKPFPILRFGSSPRAFGHTGSGGSFGYADPDAGVGYAYVMNRNGYSLPTDKREIALRQALQSSLN